MSKIHQLFGMVYLLHVLLIVLARHTDATRVAGLSLGETLAIQFQTVDLRALTALLLQRVTRGEVQLLNGFEHFFVLVHPAEV
jgi:hypothetical protein